MAGDAERALQLQRAILDLREVARISAELTATEEERLKESGARSPSRQLMILAELGRLSLIAKADAYEALAAELRRLTGRELSEYRRRSARAAEDRLFPKEYALPETPAGVRKAVARRAKKCVAEAKEVRARAAKSLKPLLEW